MQTLNTSTCHIKTQTIDIHSVCPMCGYIFGQLYSKMYKNVVVELSVSLKTFTHTKKDIQKTKIMTFGSITSWQIDGKQWKQRQIFFFFLVAGGGGEVGSKITADGYCSHETKTLAPWKKSYDQPRQHIEKQ